MDRSAASKERSGRRRGGEETITNEDTKKPFGDTFSSSNRRGRLLHDQKGWWCRSNNFLFAPLDGDARPLLPLPNSQLVWLGVGGTAPTASYSRGGGQE